MGKILDFLVEHLTPWLAKNLHGFAGHFHRKHPIQGPMNPTDPTSGGSLKSLSRGRQRMKNPRHRREVGKGARPFSQSVKQAKGGTVRQAGKQHPL